VDPRRITNLRLFSETFSAGIVGMLSMMYLPENEFPELQISLGAEASLKSSIYIRDFKKPLLFHAAQYGDDNTIAEFLKDKKCDLNSVDVHKNSALDIAIESKKLSTTSLLLQHGAIVKNPFKLKNFLEKSDQRDFRVLNSLNILCDQVRGTALEKAYEPIFSYHQKLLKIFSEVSFEILKAAATEKFLPQVLLLIIAEYHAEGPMRTRFTFFDALKIDDITTTIEKGKSNVRQKK
jgi:hypothetical protein